MPRYELLPFTGLDETTRSEIGRYTKQMIFKKGETPFTHGELNRYFYIVIRGKIKSYQLNLENAKEQTIFIYREGDMFDTIILLDGKDHDIMYEVMEESEVLQMPIAYVRELISTNKAFNSKFFPYLAQQMRHMEELSTDLSLYSTSERLIKLLLQNLDPGNIMKYNLLQGLSNTEIAKLIGTVRHVVERHLKALKEDGTIETKHKNVQILDTGKLLDKIKLF